MPSADLAKNPALSFILQRRSVAALVEPGPTPTELEALLEAATTAPDHGGLRPYRFLVVEGEGRGFFGEALVAAALEERPALGAATIEKVRKKAFAAPALVALIATPRAGSTIPTWEQIATASCAGFAIVLAAHALGLGAIWKSTPFGEGVALRARLGMQADDRLLGWINLGRRASEVEPVPRAPVELARHAAVVGAKGIAPYDPPAR